MISVLLQLVALLLALGLFFGYTRPILDDINALGAQEQGYTQALENADALRGLRDQLLAKYNAFNPNDLVRLEKLLPSSVDNVRLVIDVNNIASKYSMELKNVRVKSSADTETASSQIGPQNSKYGTVLLSFTVTAPYEVFRLFLGDLEKSLRLVDVTNLSFAATDRNLYDFNVELRTYWLK